MRSFRTKSSTNQLLNDPVVEFDLTPDLEPGDHVFLISISGIQVEVEVDDVDENTIYFRTFPVDSSLGEP